VGGFVPRKGRRIATIGVYPRRRAAPTLAPYRAQRATKEIDMGSKLEGKTMEERWEAAARDADECANDMLSVLEEEIEDAEAFESEFRARRERVISDDTW
jgi:hypothetical protein